EVGGAPGERTEDEPVDDLAAPALGDPAFTLFEAVGLVDEDGESALLRGFGDVLRELGEVRRRQVRDRERDDAGSPGAKSPGRGVRDEAEFVDRGLHLGAYLR